MTKKIQYLGSFDGVNLPKRWEPETTLLQDILAACAIIGMIGTLIFVAVLLVA